MPIDIFGSSGNYFYQDLDLNGHKIINCNNPTDAHDVATKQYVDSRRSETRSTDGSNSWNTDGNELAIDGKLGSTSDKDFDIIRNNESKVKILNDSIEISTDLNALNHKIINCSNPLDPQDVATKNYIDTTSWAVNGNNLMNDGKMGSLNDTNFAIMRNNTWRMRFMPHYCEVSSNLFIRTIGGDARPTAISLGSNSLQSGNKFSVLLGTLENAISWTNTVNAPINIVNQYGVVINKNGINIMSIGTASSGVVEIHKDLMMKNHWIAQVRDPNSPQDAATKNYVDTRLTSNFIMKTGGTMTGDLILDSGRTRNMQILCTNLADLNYMNIGIPNAYIRFIRADETLNSCVITSNQTLLQYADGTTYFGMDSNGVSIYRDLIFDASGGRDIKLICKNIDDIHKVVIRAGNTDIPTECGTIIFDKEHGHYLLKLSASAIRFQLNGNNVFTLESEGITCLLSMSMFNNSIINLNNPVNDQDAATKNYVDQRVLKTGDSMTGNLVFDGIGNKDLAILVNNLNEGHYFSIAVDAQYSFIKFTKGRSSTSSHCLIKSTSIGFNVGEPQNAMAINRSNITINKPMSFNNNIISNVNNPVSPQDVATKSYVDNRRCLSGYIPPLSANRDKTGFSCSASTEYSASLQAWNAFSNTNADWCTLNETSNFWIKIGCPEPIRVWRFKLAGRSNESRISNWRFEGSVDDDIWTPLYTAALEYIGRASYYELLNNPEYYKWYRVYVVHASGSAVGLSHFQLYTYLI